MASPFGSIENPLTKINPNGYGDLTGVGGAGGLIGFISNVLKFITVGAGLFALFNLIFAGLIYIGAGSDVKKTKEALDKINMSLIGLVVIVASYAIASVVGLLLFGDATAILSPKIYGPGANQ
jgi:uncharacterized membrane protein